MERHRRPAPDVEEALSSMLWTPYERTPPESSDDDEPIPSKPSSHSNRLPRPTSYVEPQHPTSSHLYPAPIRYLQRWSHHTTTPLLPITHLAPNLHFGINNGGAQSTPSPYSSLPSYESVEQERLHHHSSSSVSATKRAGEGRAAETEAGIYLISPYAVNNNNVEVNFRAHLVHSFTDDFAQYREVSYCFWVTLELLVIFDMYTYFFKYLKIVYVIVFC